MKKNKLFYGGTIITMDKYDSIVEAVYVEDNKIKDIGKLDILKQKYNNYEAISLQGKTMFPGFIEPHVHIDLSAMCSQMHIISGLIYENKDDVIYQIKKAVEQTPRGHWVMCFGLDYLINRDLPMINRYWLDQITTEHPLAIIIQSMHTMYVNSMALKKAGINKMTKDTRDGHCIKDKNGEPMGILTEQGFIVPIVNLWLNDLQKDPKTMIQEELIRFRDSGVTTLWTAGYTPLYPHHFQLLYNIFNDSQSPVRGDYSISFNSIENGQVNLDNEFFKNSPMTKFTGIKSWYDGSPYTGNMLMYKNYLENDTMQNKLYIKTNNHGERLFKQEFFYKMLKKYYDQGHQLSIHAQGDQSCHEVIDILERIIHENPRPDHRCRLEHCAFIDKEDVKRCQDLGITLSFHTNHLYYYAEALNELVLGQDVASKMFPCKTALDHNIKITFHSDAPMYTANPLRVASTAVTRTSRNGTIIGKDEAITLKQALRGITIDAAWQILREKEIGSIEIGKYADFTILEENPYEVDPQHIGDIHIFTTYINGIDTKTLHFK